MVKEAEQKYLKKAMSAYFIFNNEKREEVMKQHNLSGIGPVAKKLSELWAAMSDAEKGPFERKAQNDKKRYEKELAAGVLQPKPRKVKKGKKEKKVKDPNAPKRAQSAYFLWLNKNRPAIMEANPDLVGKVAEVAKKAGEMWGAMSEADKKPYQTLADKDKARYLKEMEKYTPPAEAEEEESEEAESEEEAAPPAKKAKKAPAKAKASPKAKSPKSPKAKSPKKKAKK